MRTSGSWIPLKNIYVTSTREEDGRKDGQLLLYRRADSLAIGIDFLCVLQPLFLAYRTTPVMLHLASTRADGEWPTCL